jgi:hypothetical protein
MKSIALFSEFFVVAAIILSKQQQTNYLNTTNC